MSASEHEGDDEEPWVYIHLPGKKVGDKFTRLAAKASCVKKFDFSKYQENPNAYHNEPLKYRASKNETKENCFVLVAAKNRKKLDGVIKKAKRFPVPSNNITFETSTSDNGDVPPAIRNKKSGKRNKESTEAGAAVDSGDEEVNEKKTRKSAKKIKKTAEKERNENIINKYIESQQPIDPRWGTDAESYIKTPSSSFRINPASSSTPLRQRNLPNNGQDTDTQAIISAYKKQIEFYKNRSLAAEEEVTKWKEKCEKLQREAAKGASNSSASQTDDTLAELDQIFSWNDETENPSLIQLQKGVMCNSAAYKEAMKSDRISKFFSAMCVGVYGKEDFATRCVSRRKDNMDQTELSPTKTEAIDAEFYKWMKIHKLTPLQITQNLAKCNTYYHNAITAVRRSTDPEDNSSNTTPRTKSLLKKRTKNNMLFVNAQPKDTHNPDSADKENLTENNEILDPLADNTEPSNRSRSSTPELPFP